MSFLEVKQKQEIYYWRDSKQESPQSNSIDNIINKVSNAAIYLDCLRRHEVKIPKCGRVLELGGGQGWASALFKRLHPKCEVILTDISEYAIASAFKWERLWEVKLDGSYACTSYSTKEENESIDFVFCFAAAHHFIVHRRTLLEIHRILKPNGVAIYMYEPTCPKFIYPLAFRRVNKKRVEVPEDVLIHSKIIELACDTGFECEISFFPSTRRRGPSELIYYSLLSKLTFLQKLLPCTANFILEKKEK